MVERTRLIDALSDPADVPLTLVVGPPGSGKTQLVASWVTGSTVNAAVAWVTFEDDDDQTCVFWTYVVESLRRAGVPISSALTPLPSGEAVDRSFLVRLAAEVLAQQVPVLLVLDGVSDLIGDQWATDIDFVLRHTSPMLRLVLVSRWDPPVLLHRYRLAGRLTEVRSDALAFTAEEASELLPLQGVELSPAGQSALLEHTEGWAAGLRLFAMALQGRRDADRLVETITGNEATIAEYFMDEVLSVQPPHVRAFLLETSILDTFTPELAEAVTGSAVARRLLTELARHNAFVQRAGAYSTAYRLHRLFAELLRAQLMCEAPERIAQLHRRAAAWFADQGQTVEAVSHSIKARDWTAAATVVVEHYAVGRLVLDGRGGQLGTLLRRLPADVDSVEAALVTASLALADGAVDRCGYHLGRAQELVKTSGRECTPAITVADRMLGVLLAAACGDHAQALLMSPAAEHSLTQMPPEMLTIRPELRLLLLAGKGLAHSWLGAIDAAHVSLTEVAESGAPGGERLRIVALQHLALTEAYRGRLEHAVKLAAKALDIAERCGIEGASRLVVAHLALAWVAMERYDIDAAGLHLRTADPKRQSSTDGTVGAAFALVKSRRLQARGELHAALKLLDPPVASTDEPRPPEWLAREVAVSRARLMITTDRAEEALETVSRFPEPHPPDVVVLHAAALAACGRPEQARETVLPVVASVGLATPIAVEAWLVLARIAAQLGECDNARNALGHAIRLAAPEAQRRAVQQVWAQLRRLLRDDDELAEQYRMLQGTPSAERHAVRDPTPDALVIVDPLSPRELEVLQSMAGMMPTEEIAATLYVSINTVKTHIRSILRKLSASRRNEAVRRARSLGLV